MWLNLQVPQVTEEVALAVVEVYPTLLSLAKGYSLLVSNHLFFSDIASRTRIGIDLEFTNPIWLITLNMIRLDISLIMIITFICLLLTQYNLST